MPLGIDSSTPADPIVLAREVTPRPENEQMSWWACYYRTHGYPEYTAERIHGLYRTGIDSVGPASGPLHACAFTLVAGWRGNLWWATQIDGRDGTLAGWARPMAGFGHRPALIE